jgi:transposase
MTVSSDTEADIARLFHVEHWKVGTIATQLGIHEDVVRRVIAEKGHVSTLVAPQFSPLIAPYQGLIQETLGRYPHLCASRLFDMIVDRGYSGSMRTLRRYVMEVRPKKSREAFLRLNPLVGEQSQIDWAHVGHVPMPGGGTRPLWLFILVLSYSRAMWGEFCFDMTVHSLLRSLVRAAQFFGGVTRQWLFDNPKIVVLERHGNAARFHPLLLKLSSDFCVQPRLCGPYRGNEKGRVERKIRFLRDRFLAGRHVHSIEQGNRDLLEFIERIAHRQAHPDCRERTIADSLLEEQQHLLAIPNPLPCTDLVIPVAVDKTAFIRFETNLYSVPPDFVEQTLTLTVDDHTVRILSGAEVVALHARSFGRRQKLEDPKHRAEIIRRKQTVAPSMKRDHLRAVCPDIETLVERWVIAGRNVGSMSVLTYRLLDLYGIDIFTQAIAEAISRGTHDPGAIGVLCEKFRQSTEKPVPIEVPLGEHIPDREVIPHDMGGYDGES